ncbi:MAG: ABC transporter permease subunit [Calditrichia bacterium]|nr:ABC transporter permease subunit [Calditrichia bacterium]
MKEKDNIKFRKKVDRANILTRYIISIGGYGIIVSIIGILLFLVYQSLPLSFQASVEKLFSIDLPSRSSRIVLTGIDQYQEVAYTLNERGIVSFYRLNDQKILRKDSLQLAEDEMILCASKGNLNRDIFAVGTNEGRILTAEVRMLPEYSNNQRIIRPNFKFIEVFLNEADSSISPNHIESLGFSYTEDGLFYWAWTDHQHNLRLKISDPDEDQPYYYNLTENLGEEQISQLVIGFDGRKLIAGSFGGELFWFDLRDPEEIFLQDNWKASQDAITALKFLIGDNTLVIGDAQGLLESWFPVRNQENQFKYLPVHQFSGHVTAVTQIYVSPRNRTFMSIDESGLIHLNYNTTRKTQLRFRKSEYSVQAASISPKSNGIILVDARHRLGTYLLDSEHPEVSFKTLFGKVWYEGYEEPEFVWQSTGGSDDFEPKLSLIPLIFGTLKGTFYAMIFSIPMAILAAIYVSQFSPKWLARTIKPTVEIMAALPSVVIGFLAGLYFAPLFEEYLVTIFLSLVILPVMFAVGIGIWRLVPEEKRMLMPLGWELLYVIPIILVTYFLVNTISFSVETLLFSGNFKQWIFESLGQTYDQRNSIVVGFALGFAVIPIIFTISEDALSNVPDSLASASLALGASRWQTVRKVVLPAASGGIFAAVMLGFGRAIGETMIVLMATGNTPILDISPFNGFRAMSACIAVEIPEAPVGGTLYRVLFLIAFLLFVFTFVINSLSALIGDRLRKKYSRF